MGLRHRCRHVDGTPGWHRRTAGRVPGLGPRPIRGPAGGHRLRRRSDSRPRSSGPAATGPSGPGRRGQHVPRRDSAPDPRPGPARQASAAAPARLPDVRLLVGRGDAGSGGSPRRAARAQGRGLLSVRDGLPPHRPELGDPAASRASAAKPVTASAAARVTPGAGRLCRRVLRCSRRRRGRQRSRAGLRRQPPAEPVPNGGTSAVVWSRRSLRNRTGWR